MNTQQQAPPPNPGGSLQLPDINAETYPFEMVQFLLDQAAYFNMTAVPDPAETADASLTPDDPSDFFGINGGFGFDIHGVLHRFRNRILKPDPGCKVQVNQATGEKSGTFTSRWLIAPDGYQWNVGQEPPPVAFNPYVSQRFVMLDCDYRLPGSSDSFRGYGIGQTYPVTIDGKVRTLAGAVGNVMQPPDRLAGLECTYVLNGEITPSLGFIGNISFRAMDPDGKIRTDREIPQLQAIEDPEPTVSYIVMRGQKRDKYQLTFYSFDDNGFPNGLITSGQMRTADYRYSTKGYLGLRSNLSLGELVGKINATIFTNVAAPPGTALRPAPFTTENVYTYFDSDGAVVGTVSANVQLGESFDLKFAEAPGQPGLRFGGIGPIIGGTGIFEGVQGLLCVNSAIGREPHALSLLNTLRIIDPDGKFRDHCG